MTHNFDLWWNQHMETENGFVAGREGVGSFAHVLGEWKDFPPSLVPNTKGGAGEVRFCPFLSSGNFVTIEPMHGNQVAFYPPRKEGEAESKRVLLDDTLAEGHALACADLLGLDRWQVVAGWRAPNKDKKVGIKLYVPLDDKGEKWETHLIDDNQMACEDLKIADLDGDGRPDIIAAGRATHNLVIYWNRTKR